MALVPYASTEQLTLLVRHHLMTDSGVKSLVGPQVHGSNILTPDTGSVEYPCVVMDVQSGRASPTSTFQMATLHLYTYSRQSSGEAIRIYDACFSALQHQLMRRDGVPIAGYCIEDERPTDSWNEFTRAYFVRGTWAVRMSYRSGQ